MKEENKKKMEEVSEKIKNIKISQRSQHDVIKEVLLEILQVIEEELKIIPDEELKILKEKEIK